MVLSAALVGCGGVITACLKRLLADKGPSAAMEAWTATGLSLLDFLPKASALLHVYMASRSFSLHTSDCSSALAHVQ